MTVELVDGHAGTPHIDGDDLGDFKAGFIGSEGYVLSRDDCFAATLNSANSLSIATGSAIMPNSGRHVRVTAPETLTIISGTAGMSRYDLVVLRATTSDGTTAESAEFVVIQGTATSDTPTDPEIQDGDLPLYRLALDGITVAEPIALFDVLVPYAEFQDSVSLAGENILWSGVYYMNENQTITLSETVSEQHSGIVLVFSGYDVSTSAALNYQWHSFFIPKGLVAAQSGTGHSFLMSRGGNIAARKYLYISDNSIRGYSDNNNSSYSLLGRTIDNRSMVLRYVYGV